MDIEQVLDILCDKMEGRSDLTWSEVVDYCDLDISPDTLRKAFSANLFGGYAMLKAAQDRYNNCTTDEQVEKLNDKIEQLKEERRKLQLINREHNETIRANADKQLFDDLIVDAIHNLKPIRVVPTTYKSNSDTKNKGCLFFGDAHYGTEFELKGIFGEVINKYSPEIFKARMWRLLSEMDNDAYDMSYDELHIFDCGDAIDGILRTGNSLRKLKVGVVDGVLEYAEFIATWLAECQSRLGVHIKYHLTGGNHDTLRLLGQKKDFDDENVAKLIHKYVELRLKASGVTDVEVAPYDEAIFENVNGVNILCYHGCGKNMEQDINFFENYYNVQIDMLAGAHLHHKDERGAGVADVGDREVVRVPSIMGTNDFAKTIRAHSRAGAKFMIIEPDKGRTWEKIIWLN